MTQLRPAIWPRDCQAREYCDLTLRALRMEDYATTPRVQSVLAAGFNAGLLLGANEEFLIDQ